MSNLIVDAFSDEPTDHLNIFQPTVVTNLSTPVLFWFTLSIFINLVFHP